MIGDIFNIVLLQPLINFIISLIRLFEYFHVPGALGFAIIFLTLIIKGVLWPFSVAQLRSARHLSTKMAELKPQIDLLKEKHKDDKLAFSQAQSSLFKEHGVNPAAGCLPSLVQAVLLIPLYQVILALFDEKGGLGRINYFLYNKAWHLDHLPDPHFLGLNLADKPNQFAQAGIFLLAVPLITALLQIILSLMMSPTPVKEYPTDSTKEKKEKETAEDMTAMMQNQMLFMFPAMIGFFAFSLPIGLSLYWNSLNLLSIFQQYSVTGLGRLANVKSFLQRKQVQSALPAATPIKVEAPKPSKKKKAKSKRK